MSEKTHISPSALAFYRNSLPDQQRVAIEKRFMPKAEDLPGYRRFLVQSFSEGSVMEGGHVSPEKMAEILRNMADVKPFEPPYHNFSFDEMYNRDAQRLGFGFRVPVQPIAHTPDRDQLLLLQAWYENGGEAYLKQEVFPAATGGDGPKKRAYQGAIDIAVAKLREEAAAMPPGLIERYMAVEAALRQTGSDAAVAAILPTQFEKIINEHLQDREDATENLHGFLTDIAESGKRRENRDSALQPGEGRALAEWLMVPGNNRRVQDAVKFSPTGQEISSRGVYNEKVLELMEGALGLKPSETPPPEKTTPSKAPQR